MKKILEKIQNEKGISLIELVVAVSVFSLVVMATSGIFLNAIKTQRTIIAKKNVAEDAQYVMEFMVKELRMAKINVADLTLTFNDGAGSQLNFNNSPSSVVSFINFNNETIKYSLLGNKIQRNDIDITSGGIKINSLGFTLNNWDLSVGPAPLVSILIKAESVNGVGGQIEMQATISPRIY